VAAHLEPEILIVDEVLAVGDAQFQKKCLGKMGDVAREGRTVLFVSHNMGAVKSLCNIAMLLDRGHITAEGETGDVVSRYLQTSVLAEPQCIWNDSQIAPGTDQVRLRLARVAAEDGTPVGQITVNTPLAMEFEYWNFVPTAERNLSVVVRTIDGTLAFSSASSAHIYPIGLIRSVCRIPAGLLNDGVYVVTVMIVRDQSSALYTHEDILAFEVGDVDREGNWYGRWPGVVRPQLPWTDEYIGLDAEDNVTMCGVRQS
jgi:lipopolysaccharide transport system ATP-binding protein